MNILRSYFENGKKKNSYYNESVENPQSLINKERLSRIVHSQKPQLTGEKPKSFFEQFIVVGVKKENGTKVQDPELLYQYPKVAPIPDVVSFCFPTGIKVKHLRRTPSYSSLYELLCHQVDPSHSSNSFIFLLTTENREILYGVCVIKEESIEHPPSFISKETTEIPKSQDATTPSVPTTPSRKSLASPLPKGVQNIGVAPRCYCFITKYPFFQLHFDILYGILGMEHVYQITQPYLQSNHGSGSYSEYEHLDDTKEEPMSPEQRPAEESNDATDVLQILQKYHKLAIPNPGQTVEFRFNSSSKPIYFARPLMDEEDEGFREWALPLALHTLSKKNLFNMFNACILEKKVAFVSTNLRILSAVVLALLPLLRPFVYQSVCIPILPSKMISLLEAPVPFVVGITYQPERWPSDVILLNLDDNVLYQSVTLPNFPRIKGFENEFPALYSELKKTWVKDEKPYIPTSKQLRLSKKISSLFAKSLSSMFASFKEHCITDMSQKNTPVTVFIKESFLESVPHENLQWYTTLVETQSFFHYIDTRLRKLDRLG